MSATRERLLFPIMSNNDTQFMTVLSGIFGECERVLKRPAGRLVFTFHHWDPNAWAELTIALKHAAFRLVNAYVLFSEHPISVHINNLNSIKHDSILVLAPADSIPAEAKEWSLLRQIDTGESEAFCRQCSEALGWFLASDCPSDEIRSGWKRLIEGK